METTTPPATQPRSDDASNFWSRVTAYDRWVESTGVPVHTGYYIPDIRELELGWWPERECQAAFLKLAGQEGVTEARVSEIAPGATLPPLKFALDEAVYVAEGRGITTLWSHDGGPRTSFEWQKHSLFLIPRNSFHQFSNVQGNRPARLLHYNYLPITMGSIPDARFLFDNPYIDRDLFSSDQPFFSEATTSGGGPGGGYGYWTGNFFPDMRAWDRLNPYKGRGAGGHAVWIRFPTSPIWSHMSVFPARSYKKAHRHGPGVVIVIPGGEGFSFMWEEGKEKVFIPWHEGSVFVPPNRWFHQHFNVTGDSARYLALHSPRGLNNYSEKVEDLARDQIEYPNEDPIIRQTFEAELAKRGVKSAMPEPAYRDPTYEWTYAEDGDS
jgi:quercetin dioxygenase-like cupin family protein